jgi:transposase
VSGLGLPVEIVLTAGQESDIGQAKTLLGGHEFKAAIADKGYDSAEFVDHVESLGAQAVIPPRKSRTEQREYDRHLYKERNLAERFWHKAKQFRRVATRYDKTDRNYLAFVLLAAIMVLLR